MQFGDWVGIAVGVVLFVIGVPLGIAIGRRNRQQPDLRTTSDFDEVVQPGHWLLRGGLDIEFEGSPLSSVSRTYVAFWNHRGDTVSGSDALDTDPLRIVVGEGDSVHQVRLVAYSREQVSLTARVGEDAAFVSFGFLDAGDGGIFEVLHHGTQPARIEGTIPGAKISKSRDALLSFDSRARVRNNRFLRLFSPRRPAAFWSLFLSSVLGIFALTLPSARRLYASQTPQLVPAADYDLKTLIGQSDFASKVTTVGSSDVITQIVDICSLAFGISTLTLFFFVASRAAIPRSIVRVDIEA